MRIVQSVKHTKKREGQWLKEGWLVHFTNKDKTVSAYSHKQLAALGTHFNLFYQNYTQTKLRRTLPLLFA